MLSDIQPSKGTLMFRILDSSDRIGNKLIGKPKIAEKKKTKTLKPDLPVDVFDFKSIGTLTSVF